MDAMQFTHVNGSIGLAWMNIIGVSHADIKSQEDIGKTSSWLLALGVEEQDVEWVKSLTNTPIRQFEHHLVQYRLESIYRTAYKNLTAIETIEIPTVVYQ